jgi:crotonobetainyl-CoA:carnitine CoA-transferase CaiB-like acyl-CoA transferase
MKRAAPLEGICVLDLTRLIPGPFCTLILADLGAEVIKIEEPNIGDYERQIGPFQGKMAYRFMLLNRNKKSVSLNLKGERDHKKFIELVGKSDVVVEGFRPGVMDKLGIGYYDLKKINSNLVYCSINSYGYSGPYKNKVAHDINILAETGLLDLMGFSDGPPVIPGIQLVDTVTALYAVIGIQAALAARSKTGEGQHVDVSMHDCTFSLMFDSIRYALAEGRTPMRGVGRLTGGLANYNIYKTKDHRYVAVGALEKKFKNTFLRCLGLDEYVEESGAVTESEVNTQKEKMIKERLQDIFKQKSLAEWQDILGPSNVFFSPIVTVQEVLKDPQLKSREMIMETEHPVAGKIVQIGSPIKLSAMPVDLDRLPAPQLGEHTLQVLGQESE